MALGTLLGGWRIVHTMGPKITRLTPMQGFCAETGGAVMLYFATALGAPTHVLHCETCLGPCAGGKSWVVRLRGP